MDKKIFTILHTINLLIQIYGTYNISMMCFFVLFDLILNVPVNNFSVMSGRVFMGWTSTKQGLMWLAQGHNTVMPMGLEPATPRSRVKQYVWCYTSDVYARLSYGMSRFCYEPSLSSILSVWAQQMLWWDCMHLWLAEKSRMPAPLFGHRSRWTKKCA